jgi:hypothetical protein
MAIEQTIRIEGHILEGQAADSEGKEVRVTVLVGGKSVNGYAYDESALRTIANMIEGAKAYADHARTDADSVTRSVRDIVGFYHDAAYIPPDATCPGGRVEATLHIMEVAPWLSSLVKEAISLGKPDLVGLSIDIYGTWQLNEATKAKDVTKILSLNSCDVVTKPSAGGSFQRILQSQQGEFPHMDPQKTSTNVINPDPISSDANHSGISSSDVLRTGVIHHAPTTLNSPTNNPSTPTPTTDHIQEQQQLLEQQRQQIEQLMQQAKLDRAQLVLERRLQESILPGAVKAQVKVRFTGRIFEESELEQEMSTALTMLAQLTKDGLIRGNGYEKVQVSGMITEAEKVQAAFDLIFEKDGDMADVRAKFPGIKGFTSIREAYARVTGDPSVVGISARSELGSIRVSESAPIVRITEADTTTASFSYLLGTSMNKRLLKDYQAWPAEWVRFCTITPIKDFKQQTRVRLGAFGSLPIVAEDTAYTSVSLSDTAAVYVPQKRGNLVTVSRETIVNDDLFAIKQIPTKLAVAAAYTLAEFVYGFLSTNPTIYDGNALFTSGAPHSNLGAAALSTAAMQTGVTAMREQTNFAGKRIGLRPKFLVVPPELEFVAMVVTKSAGVPGSNNNDINPMLGYVTPIVSPQLTNTSQWFFVADPMVIDTIEVGFVGGQVNPALFVQDQPLFGLNFTQDVIS